jgi:NodT family efflux transporter outer membrane factor (OMF) lipoprotein
VKSLTPLLAALLLTGCVVPQVEEPVGKPIDAAALGLTDSTVAPASQDWWTAFGDTQLNALIEQATQDSPTLAQALARVRMAQAQAQAAGAATRPGFSIDGEESWQRFSENYYIPPPFAGHTYWIGGGTANLNWDLDFWGRQAALIAQTRSQLLASQLDVASARLALAGSITQAYIDLQRTWTLVDIAGQQVEQREHLLKLTRQRVEAGLDTQIELETAQATLEQARGARLQALAARDLTLHRLAALTGHGADTYAQIERPQLQLDTAFALPDTLPMDLLAHRPDIAAARARVEAATAGREAAHAAFYPDVSLKAFVGTQAIGLDKLFDAGSLVYGAGPAIHLPIFEAQRLRAGYRGATAELDQSIASYNASVLNAVRETADQISLNDSLGQQIETAHRALNAATAAYDLAVKRYGAGLTTQLVVLNAQSHVLDAQRELLAVTTARTAARINLLLTLGGSFDAAASTTHGVL